MNGGRYVDRGQAGSSGAEGDAARLSGTTGDVPVALSTFVGRAGDVPAVSALLAEHRAVTLTGAGGTGKTRLAQEIGHSLRHAGVPVRWVDLAPLGARGDVAAEIGRSLGIAAPPGVDPIHPIVDRLRDAPPTVLVIDNAEHVIDAAAQAVRSVLSGCEDARVLLTSREPLGLAGEVVWRVPPLGVPDAVEDIEAADASRLFLARAREQRPGLVLDAAARDAVVTVCRRLDGLPLALELAAARARTMSLERVAGGLDDAFRLLGAGTRSAVPRQQTLRASVEWSVDLLSEEEQVVFRCLAVFPASFTAAAAEAVMSGSARTRVDHAADVLSRLVDKSLVQFDDRTGRYRLLGTMRQFALERLVAAGEEHDVRQRHADWWSRFCTEIGYGAHGAHARDLDWIMPDVAAAEEWSRANDRAYGLRMARGLGWVRPALGYWAALDRTYDAIIATPPPERDRDWAGALAGLSLVPLLLGRTEIYELVPEALPLLTDDDGGRRLLGFATSLLEALDGRPDALRALASSVIAVDDVRAYPYVVGSLLSIATGLGNLTEAREMYELLARTLARQQLPYASGTALFGHYGTIHLLMEEGRLEAARALVRAGGDMPDGAMVAASAAAVAALGSAMDDEALITMAARWLEDEVAPGSRAAHECGLAVTAWFRGDGSDAVDHARQVLSSDDVMRPILYLHLRGLLQVLLAAGHRDEAASHMARAFDDATRLGAPPLPSASMALCRGLLALDEGDDEGVWLHGHLALELSDAFGFALVRIDALELLALAFAGRDRRASAARVLGATAAERARIGYPQRSGGTGGRADELLVQLRQEEPDAVAVGAATSADEITAYVRRMRGARSRPVAGWASLTPTERQVAELVATGSTNAEIARTLLMGVATVKTHLTHIYGKLSITSRTELAARQAQLPSEPSSPR